MSNTKIALGYVGTDDTLRPETEDLYRLVFIEGEGPKLLAKDAENDIDMSAVLVTGDITGTNVTVTGGENKALGDVTLSLPQSVAPEASPTFAGLTVTGNVTGITKAMVGLENVNNTSDADKPVSRAQREEIDLKQNRVVINRNAYVNTSIKECFIDKGANVFDLYVYKLWKNSNNKVGIEIRRSDTSGTVFYTEYNTASVAPRIYENTNSGIGVTIKFIIDWTKVNIPFSDFTGTSVNAVFVSDVYSLSKNYELNNLANNSEVATLKTYVPTIVANENIIEGIKNSYTDISISIITGKFVHINGSLNDFGSARYTNILPLGLGIDYYYSGTVQFQVAAYTFYDKNNQRISSYPSTNQATAIVLNNEKIIAPAGAAFVRFSSYTGTLTITKDTDYSIRLLTKTNAASLAANTANIATNTADLANINTYRLGNDPIPTISGGYLQINSGGVTANVDSFYTDFLPIISGVEFYYSGRAQFSVAAFAFFNENKAIISTYPNSSQSVAINLSREKVIPPSNAKFVRFSSYQVAMTVRTLNFVNGKIDNPLLFKRINFVGTSITLGGGGAVPDAGGWPTIISSKNYMVSANNGVGGSTIQKRGSRTDSIVERLETYSTNYDYLLLEGAVNDLTLPVGTITSGYNASLDLFTFCGAAEYMCKLALTKWSGKKVGFVMDYIIGSLEWITLADKLEEILKKWGMPYLDLRKSAGFNLANDELASIYGVTLGGYPEYSPTIGYTAGELRKINGSLYSANVDIISPAGAFNSSLWTPSSLGSFDRWHCNVKGYQLLAPKIESFLRSL